MDRLVGCRQGHPDGDVPDGEAQTVTPRRLPMPCQFPKSHCLCSLWVVISFCCCTTPETSLAFSLRSQSTCRSGQVPGAVVTWSS
ncbi:unnamed protein product [Boreogadus saida]